MAGPFEFIAGNDPPCGQETSPAVREEFTDGRCCHVAIILMLARGPRLPMPTAPPPVADLI